MCAVLRWRGRAFALGVVPGALSASASQRGAQLVGGVSVGVSFWGPCRFNARKAHS